jgi:hypothetical protein
MMGGESDPQPFVSNLSAERRFDLDFGDGFDQLDGLDLIAERLEQAADDEAGIS